MDNLINITHSAVKAGYNQNIDVISKGLRVGYLIEPEISGNPEVSEFLESQRVNPGATFYKDWESLMKAENSGQRLLDQLCHYMSTYGTDFTEEAYIPNPDISLPDFTWSELTVISAVSEEEMFQTCYDMIKSGVPMKTGTVIAITEYLVGSLAVNDHPEFDLALVKNREAKIYLYDGLRITPRDKFELLRYICYKTTGTSMVIKSFRSIDLIKAYSRNFDMTTLSDEQLRGLSSIFYRFKPIFLALRTDPKNKPVINLMRRLAKKYHQPLKLGFWESLLSECPDPRLVYEKSDEIGNYKIISLINTIRERLQEMNSDSESSEMYIIRNGAMWIKGGVNRKSDLKSTYLEIALSLRQRLIENLMEKACTVKFPDHLELACPTSEKNFIGDIPFGSSIKLTENSIIGIYWRNEWGTHDYDLSMLSRRGHKIGWNSEWTSDEWLYSGDMTNADPEAAELLYSRKGVGSDGLIMVNRYDGNPGSQFKFFVATESIPSPESFKDYMVNPDNIRIEAFASPVNREYLAGVKLNNQLYFLGLEGSDNRVSINRKDEFEKYYEIISRKAIGMLSLKEILIESGFQETTENPDIDLSESALSRKTLLDLFA